MKIKRTDFDFDIEREICDITNHKNFNHPKYQEWADNCKCYKCSGIDVE